MRKKGIVLVILISFILLVTFMLRFKWNTNVYMELTGPTECNKIDLKLEIDGEIIFDDTLSIQPFNFPQYISHPLRIGWHDVTVTSHKIGLYKKRRIFLMFNQFIATNYHGINGLYDEPSFIIWTGNNPFRYE